MTTLSTRATKSRGRPTRGDDRDVLLQMIDEAYHLPNWNNTHLRGAIRRVTPEMAGWRPPHAKRSIADIVVHCAYWKYALRRKLEGGDRGGFPLKGSNWFATAKSPNAEDWSGYVALLEREHEHLRDALQQTQLTLDFRRPVKDGKWTLVQHAFWLAIHDGYHTGQINLLKAMYRRAHR
jgi:uncharacterized damage-inducible protein DinB